MKIGIDIDDTMTYIKDDLLNAAIKYDIKLGHNGIPNNEYYIGKMFNWTKEEYFYFMSTIREEVVNNAKLRNGIIETLTKLINDGIEIVIITARRNYYYHDVYNMTFNWLKKEHIPYTKLIVEAVDKAKLCQNEKIDIFLDDDVNNCTNVSKLGIKTYIMDNQDNYLDNPLITRIYDFNDFYKYVKNYIQNKK